MKRRMNLAAGFTLIELSIVLVIIGLIVGGVLVGQDLIRAAYVRAQITQIEKLNAAVNTFYGKYQALPGDMSAGVATQFGFAARTGGPCNGDGNGILAGWDGADGCVGNALPGEGTAFFSDLSYANGLNINLIEGSFQQGGYLYNGAIGITAGNGANYCGGGANSFSLSQFLPTSKIGRGNFIYPYSFGGMNYYGLAQVVYISGVGCGAPPVNTNPGLTVMEAYNIDRKTDDGYPQSGNVFAAYLGGDYSHQFTWAGTSDLSQAPTFTPVNGTSGSCFDNNGGTGPQHYATEVNHGAGLNCALTFKFQ